ncbi:MAG: Shikimate kinase [Firmicutes bacterium]|nr:Shikimate kinase [Bacillota bacterium]
MRNIVLIGFMGTGKTSTGKLLANRLGYFFIDTDNKIEIDNKISINDMFAQYGEKYFRNKEAETIHKVAEYHNAVISTGGGVVLNEDNMIALRQNGIIITLKASIDVILERTGRRKNTRPLLKEDGRQIIVDLLETRDALYQRADLIINTSELSPLQVTDEIIKFIRKVDELRA